jgi:hypothetical protein
VSMDYPYIRAWNRLMNATSDVIENEVAAARKEKAPPTSVYKRKDGVWEIFEGIVRGETKQQLAELVAKMEKRSKK